MRQRLRTMTQPVEKIRTYIATVPMHISDNSFPVGGDNAPTTLPRSRSPHSVILGQA